MKSLLFLLILSFCQSTAFATAQIPDKILYQGKEYSLETNPLESYFAKHPDRRPKNRIISSALWRGYVATFEIVDNQLILKNIEIEGETITKDEGIVTEIGIVSMAGDEDSTIWKSVMNEVFPDQPYVKIDWFTGLLVLPHGALINYVHMDYASTYERYLLLEINAGNFIKDQTFTHQQYEVFKEKQFLAFKKTKAYQNIVNTLKDKRISKDPNTSNESIDEFLKTQVTKYSSSILVE